MIQYCVIIAFIEDWWRGDQRSVRVC